MINTIYKYINEYKSYLISPKYIPLTRNEMQELIDNNTTQYNHIDAKINNISVVESAFAVEKRAYQEKSLKAYNFTILEENDLYPHDIDMEIREYQDHITEKLKTELFYRIYTDDTELSHTFECDPLKWLKEKLHITNWFPVKTKTIKIDGKVLYPKLNIPFPHNTHTVKFKIS
jgi:hypothetical protein